MDDVMPFVVGSVVIILVIVLSIRMQISTMEGLDELTVENNQRLAYKSAGALHVTSEGENRAGVITRDQYNDMAENCAESIPGFARDPLVLEKANCGDIVTPLPVPLQIIEPDGEIINTRLMVGETSEGFN
jgi:hypothetical protein